MLDKGFKKIVEKQIIQEYRKNGFVKDKVILLTHDDDDNIIFCHKNLSKGNIENDDVFFDGWVKNQKIIDKLIKNVTDDGYRIISMVTISYIETDTDEYVSTSFRLEKGVVNVTYIIEKKPTLVSDDGIMVLNKPNLCEVID